MRCKLINFVDDRGRTLDSYACHKGVVHARIIRLDKHPLLGPPEDGKYTVTSAVRLVNFQGKYLITQYSIYDFSGS